MNLERKVKIQQTIIEQLQEEKQQLIKENKELRNHINSEKTQTENKQDDIERLQKELQKCIEEYKAVTTSLNDTKAEYDKKIIEMSELKKEYKQEMNSIIKSIKKGL